MSVSNLLAAAWGLPTGGVIGPGWIDTARYDIEARGSVADGFDEIQPKLQTLLRNRFAAVVHLEQRETPTYDLVRARPDRLGPHLVKSRIVDCADRAAIAALVPPAKPCMFTLNSGQLTGTIDLGTIVQLLSGPRAAGRRVFDKTGLQGFYDIELRWTPTLAGDAARDDSVSIFTAVQEQLGLKLESTTAPLDVLVVDHIERPTAN
jgi:uncharacterized protein (TIGR03435 family)